MRPVSSVRRRPPHSMVLRLISNIQRSFFHVPRAHSLRRRTGAERRSWLRIRESSPCDRRMRTLSALDVRFGLIQRALASRAAGLTGRHATKLRHIGALAENRLRRNRQVLLTTQSQGADQGLIAVLVGLPQVV